MQLKFACPHCESSAAISSAAERRCRTVFVRWVFVAAAVGFFFGFLLCSQIAGRIILGIGDEIGAARLPPSFEIPAR